MTKQPSDGSQSDHYHGPKVVWYWRYFGFPLARKLGLSVMVSDDEVMDCCYWHFQVTRPRKDKK